MPPTLFSDAEVESWVLLARSAARGAKSSILLPTEDRPRMPEMPPVQALDGAPTRVDVEVKPSSDLGINVKVEPSSYFTALVERAESRADLRRLHIALSVGFSCPVEIGRHGRQVEPTIERDDSIASHCAAVSIQVGS